MKISHLLNKWKHLNWEAPLQNETTKFTTLNLRLRVLNPNTIDTSSWCILWSGLPCELSVRPVTTPAVTEKNVPGHPPKFPRLQNCPWLRTTLELHGRAFSDIIFFLYLYIVGCFIWIVLVLNILASLLFNQSINKNSKNINICMVDFLCPSDSTYTSSWSSIDSSPRHETT